MGDEWQELVFGVPLDGTEIWLLTADGCKFRACYQEGFINSANDDCGTWCATTDDYPPSWTDGAFWEVNAEQERSVEATHWKPTADAESKRRA
jgi:hypothetical protein